MNTTQPHLTQYVGIYTTEDERWPIEVQPITVEDRDDFPEPGYLHVAFANGVEFYDAVERISRYVAAGTWTRLEQTCDDCGGSFPYVTTRLTNCEGVARFFTLCDECNALWDDPNDVPFGDRAFDPTEWTVCPRCETQIALDDYQGAAGMCDACIIDTMPEPNDRASATLVQVSDDDWRAMQDAVSTISAEENARNFPHGFVAAVAEMLGSDDEHAIYTRMDDGYRRQFFARASALASAALLALTLGGSALAADALTYTSPTSGRTLTLPFIGTPAYSDSCAIVAAWEDGSALAYCAEDGARYGFDADGGYIYDNGIKLFYRDPGTWMEEPS